MGRWGTDGATRRWLLGRLPAVAALAAGAGVAPGRVFAQTVGY